MITFFISLLTIVALAAQPALADDVDTAIENFRGAGGGNFIDDSCGYAVFPSIGKGGIGIGGVHGKNEVFVGGKKSRQNQNEPDHLRSAVGWPGLQPDDFRPRRAGV